MATPVLGYWVDRAGSGSLREVPRRAPGADDVPLRALCTGVSPGTERLVGTGRVPAAADATMAVPGMQGSFALPILYGYAFVGAIEQGARTGQRAFTMMPHQQRAVVPAADCVWLPDDVPSPRATLFANLETAWNAVHDAELAGDERVAVFGGGAVGLLTTFALAWQHRGEVVLVERDDARRAFAGRLPWLRQVAAPEAVAPGSCEVALHATGSGAGLQAALDAVGFEGRVIDLSWYGDEPVTLRLGDTFHQQRKRLVASQVGTVAPRMRAAGRAGRTTAVRTLLRDARLDALLTTPVPFAQLPQFFAGLYRGAATAPCPVVAYG